MEPQLADLSANLPHGSNYGNSDGLWKVSENRSSPLKGAVYAKLSPIKILEVGQRRKITMKLALPAVESALPDWLDEAEMYEDKKLRQKRKS